MRPFGTRTALVDWLPPAEMTGEIRRMSALFRGNTPDREDVVNVRFLELTAPAASSKPNVRHDRSGLL